MTGSAVVTGAASGIGLAVARELLGDGYDVLLSDINAPQLEAQAAALGPHASGLVGDVRDPQFASRLADFAFAQFGSVDLVFANAGVGVAAPLLTAGPELFDLTFGVNTKGAWLTVQAFARRWTETGAHGRLCITGSEHSIGFQHAGNGLYTASKHAVLGLADVLRHELPASISVSVLCPGLVATSIHDQSHIAGIDAPSPSARAFGAAVMARGMPAERVARHVIDAVLAGEFLIFTHASARAGAETRWQEIDAAFARQAPADETSRHYDANAVMAEIRAEYRSRDQH